MTFETTTEAGPAAVDPARYRAMADDRLDRAQRVRQRALDLPTSLAPLERAMRRRACELELAAAALCQIAAGRGAADDATAGYRPAIAS